jgi:hypothetical protein
MPENLRATGETEAEAITELAVDVHLDRGPLLHVVVLLRRRRISRIIRFPPT